MSAPLTTEQLLALTWKTGTALTEGRKRFRVTVIEWLSHVIILDAPNAETAEDMADTLWSEVGGDAFRFMDQGLDGFQVEEIEGGAP